MDYGWLGLFVGVALAKAGYRFFFFLQLKLESSQKGVCFLGWFERGRCIFRIVRSRLYGRQKQLLGPPTQLFGCSTQSVWSSDATFWSLDATFWSSDAECKVVRRNFLVVRRNFLVVRRRVYGRPTQLSGR